MNFSFGTTMRLPTRSTGKSGWCMSSYPLDGDKTEYMTTINEKLSIAESLCTGLRKLRILQKLAKDIPNAAEI